MTDRVLDADGLVIAFGAVRALDGLTLSATRGQITAILGPNGAGKTTFIRCCGAVVTPSSGTVQVLGLPPAQAVAEGRVSVMPQASGAWLGVKPLELLGYLASLHTHPLHVGALARRLGIDRFAGTAYRRLSGGQQQAVNLAAALVGRPELVFLDEPTAGMDPHSRHSVWDLIRELRAAGVSIVLTTHTMDEAHELADVISIVDDGRVVSHGTPAELTSDGRTLEQVFLESTTARMRP